ncbi:DNA/RNA non-specific endonuclease [Mixta hanseatica]|uniref:DNA/RNA non-specific endonuclease n=1 Tax=Mixta hanseatica TaxID=2872648 RepID=A0ABY4R7L9_9GAMM|nr:DNA/RNA non-specific endonuclease [Mixta hanseatica]UQY42826.1 DNA/RNA non-specific endonuclease [Mixta hanseatica]
MTQRENLVRQRLALTTAQRRQSVKAVAEGKTEQAEPDSRRAQRYAFQRMLERTAIIGPEADFLPTGFLLQGAERARAVALVREDGVPKGTGFLTGAGLFVTCFHVLPDRQRAAGYSVEFGYWQNEQDKIAATAVYSLDADSFWLTSPEDKLDCTLVALGEQRAGTADMALPGQIVLSDRPDKHQLGMAVNIIQHPAGAAQQVALRDNYLLARGEEGSAAANVLHYTADTDEGSSGAPVFNDSWQLVALHHGAAQDESGTLINEGIRISALVDWLKAEAVTLEPLARQRLIAALRGERALTLIEQARAAPDANYANRNGYQPDFLAGYAVPLAPILQPRAAEIAPLRSGATGTEAILDYQNFSLAVCAERRIAFLTATNIDGARYISINRDSGQPSLLAEGDSWYEDSRMDSRYYLVQSFYREFSRWFDRGHLTRRSDPTWGTPQEAIRANKDTFHFTNCSPQHFRFNQSLQYWQGVERYILEYGVLQTKKQITVLTGPVLNDQWRQYGEAKVPLMFWKVVLRIGSEGEPQATALLVSQANLLDEPRRAIAPAQQDSVPRVDEFRITVSGLESLTGLDFSAFRAWDSWQPSPGVRADPLPAALIMSWRDLL